MIILKTLLSDPKIVGSGVGLLTVGVGSYSWKYIDNQNKDVSWILTMKEIAESENETVKNLLDKYYLIDWITDDEDYNVVGYLRSEDLREIVKKIIFTYTGEEKDIFFDSKKFGGYSYTWTKESFIKDGWKNLSFDYSPILKAHCDRLLGTKMINLFPQKDFVEFSKHFEQAAGGFSWCIKPQTGKYNKKLLETLKTKQAIGVLSKDVLDKKNGLSSPGWQWHWFNTPGGRNLWCRQNASVRNATAGDKKWEELCAIAKTPVIEIESYEFQDRWTPELSKIVEVENTINKNWTPKEAIVEVELKRKKKQ